MFEVCLRRIKYILLESMIMKMVTIRTQIEFADPTIRAIDHIQDIRKAAESAGINLYSCHDVRLQYPISVCAGL